MMDNIGNNLYFMSGVYSRVGIAILEEKVPFLAIHRFNLAGGGSHLMVPSPPPPVRTEPPTP